MYKVSPFNKLKNISCTQTSKLKLLNCALLFAVLISHRFTLRFGLPVDQINDGLVRCCMGLGFPVDPEV